MKKSHKIVGHWHRSFPPYPDHIRIDVRRLSGWGERWLHAAGNTQTIRGISRMPVNPETQPVIAAVAMGRACPIEFPGMVVIRGGAAVYSSGYQGQ